MRFPIPSLLVATLALALAPIAGASDRSPAGASEGSAKPTPAEAPAGGGTSDAASLPVFVPPNRGAPTARLGGATRSSADDLPRIEALVPEQPGRTLEAQPSLYWYLSRPTDLRLELVVMRLAPHSVVLEYTLPSPAEGGIQRIDLSGLDLRLEAGASYQWLIKLVADPRDRGYDRIVGGGIERMPADAELAGRLSAPNASRPHLLAEAGVWYDALDAISRQIEATPGDQGLWNQRAALFEQVGLPELELAEGSAPGFGRR